MFTARQKLDAVERELSFRRRVYARRVNEGKMSQAFMDEQVAVFEAIKEDYEKQAAQERLL